MDTKGFLPFLTVSPEPSARQVLSLRSQCTSKDDSHGPRPPRRICPCCGVHIFECAQAQQLISAVTLIESTQIRQWILRMPRLSCLATRSPQTDHYAGTVAFWNVPYPKGQIVRDSAGLLAVLELEFLHFSIRTEETCNFQFAIPYVQLLETFRIRSIASRILPGSLRS